MDWDTATQKKFKEMIAKIPLFHRAITEQAVTKGAQAHAAQRKAGAVTDEDIVAAFFTDVPIPFYSMMVRLLGQSGFDYKKYGFPKNGIPPGLKSGVSSGTESRP